MQNQRIPKQTAAATIEGTRKRGMPRERWRDDFEGDLNITGINKKTGKQWPETVGNGG
jgi:hypothetical protein